MHGNLAFQLEGLQKAISDFLKSSSEGVPLSLEIDGFRHYIFEEIERIKKQFIQEIYLFQDERPLQRYIQLHQQELIRLMDQLSIRRKTIQGNVFSFKENELIGLATNAIEQLLEFIERHFTRYFDQDTKAPESYIILAGAEIIQDLGELQERFKALEVEQRLIDLVLHPVRRFVERVPSGNITYRRIIYTRGICKELSLVVKSGKEGVSENIRSSFLYLNFNTLMYFQYYTNFIKSVMAKADSASEQLDKVAFILKNINQTQIRPDFAYSRHFNSLKEQLVDWLNEEVIYLEKARHSSEVTAKNGDLIRNDFKIKTEISAAQLACLLKVFLDIKLVRNQNMSELFRFFVKYFQTKKLENISYEGFRVRFYSIEEGTRRSVRNLLLAMVDSINKEQ
ncbi:MAG TPA: hypothetical protein VIU12_14205 [Chryseolinea sp.]